MTYTLLTISAALALLAFVDLIISFFAMKKAQRTLRNRDFDRAELCATFSFVCSALALSCLIAWFIFQP
jgi:hypothetical protein